jgi:hypothetical protein
MPTCATAANNEDWVNAALAEAGLRGAALHRGSWAPRPGHPGVSFQDIVVARA